MRLPSVTQVLSPFTDFSMIPEAVLERASARGTMVHRICAAIALGEWVPGVPAECRGYVESFRGWFEIVEKVIFVEKRLTCNCYDYTGQLDLLCQIKGDSGLTVVDHKTPITEGPTWKGQLAGYHHLAKHHSVTGLGKVAVDRCGSLMLDPKGKAAKLKEYTRKAQDFNAFVAALTAYKYFTKE